MIDCEPLRRPRLARRVAPLLLVALWLSAASAAPAAGRRVEGPDVSSPRATFGSFLDAMVAVKKGDGERMQDAVACFDLSQVAGIVRGEAPKIARDLKTWLDKVERVDLENIPIEVEGTRWVYHRSQAGEVSLVRVDDGRWLFSEETIDSLPTLLDTVRGRSWVEGLEAGGGGPRTFADFLRDRIPDALEARVFILEHWQWITLIVLVFVGVVADRLVRLVLARWLSRLLSKSERFRDRRFDGNFERPLGIFVMAVVWRLLLPLLDLPLSVLAVLTFATNFVMTVAAVWAAYRLVDVISAHFIALSLRTESKIDDILAPMIRRALKIVVMAFGLLFIAQNLDIDITSLLAGLGLGGLAFALAAKDTVENLFGSVTVLVDRPFQIGDWVVIDDLEGTVEQIGFRSTRIRTFYNSLISVPNARLVHTAVDNLGVRSYRRIKCMVSVQYDTPVDKIEAFCEGIRELIRRHPYTRKDYYMVYLNAFAASSLDILLYAFHQTPDWATELRERHRLFADIVRLARSLGVEFAFPTRTLHVASVPPGVGPRVPSPGAPPEQAAVAAAPQWSEAGLDEAIRLGRAEADAIVKSMGNEEAQSPVDFRDPERIRPGA